MTDTTARTTIPFNRIDAHVARRHVFLQVLVGAMMCVALLAICIGPVSISPAQVLETLFGLTGFSFGVEVQPYQEAVILGIRLPRTVLALASGGALGVAGAVLQGLFRNPLADPGLIGISSGAALAAVITIVLGWQIAPAAMAFLGPYALPIAAFLGSVTATLLILQVASFSGRVQIAIVLLAGIAINALAAAGIGYMTFLSNDQQLRELTFWTLGSFASASWSTILPAVVAMGIALVLLFRLAKGLNALLLGEGDAYHLGINVPRLKLTAVLASALAVGAGVALTGVIAFVGLVVPHLVRMVIGPDHRYLLPGAFFLGAGFLTMADLLCRVLVAPAELPVGVVMSAIGAPFFLWILIRRGGTGMGGA